MFLRELKKAGPVKRYTFSICCILFLVPLISNAQDTASYTRMFRFYYDNDFINVLGEGTDHQYTGGIRADLYYIKHHDSRFFIDRAMPKAGRQSVNTFGWSLMQIAFTPDDLTKKQPDVNDYPYAGAIFITHTLHSANPQKKFGLQTELLAGVMGPFSFAKETQEGIHRWIHYIQPQGWNDQMPTDLLLNLNLTAEKMIWNPHKWFEMQAGATLFAGTMTDGANIYTQLRFGKMVPYFNGYISQYGSPRVNKPHRFQIYITAKPGLSWTGYYALLDGGIFNGRSDYYKQTEGLTKPYQTDKHIHPFFDGGLVLSFGKSSLSITQKIMPPLLQGFDSHAVGNISFTTCW